MNECQCLNCNTVDFFEGSFCSKKCQMEFDKFLADLEVQLQNWEEENE